MCSDFLQTMENYQGDLADIFRASGVNGSGDPSTIAAADWQLFQSWASSSDPILNYGTIVSSSSTTTDGTQNPSQNFGHPFNTLRDPLLEELDMSTPPTFFPPTTITTMATTSIDDAGGQFRQKMIIDHNQDTIINTRTLPHNNRNHNIFSRMLQISPNINGSTTTTTTAATTNTTRTSKLPLSPPCDAAILKTKPSSSLMLSNDMINANTSSKGCLVENTALQIPSPRNTGIKRRKSQAKKVVCIPAPAPANSRPTGEVVPSDLWAWRKYGQKPIKGSPYPRGYYRCSSSKGCSARKQVERSRTDPNMLVITYTSEHNHPWPTQRNALAGSTRNQPSKSNNTNSSSTSKNSPAEPGGSQKVPTNLKEEPKDPMIIVPPPIGNSTTTILDPMIKEETEEEEEEDRLEKETEMMDDQFSSEHQVGFQESYRPALPLPAADSISNQDFFADLGEIEADPLNLLFSSQGFSSGGDHEEREHSKSLDPFSFYDWAAAGKQ